MAKLLSFEAIGFREARGRFAARDRLLQREKRQMVRDVSIDYRNMLFLEAPRDTQAYADGIAYRTDNRGNITRGTVFVGGPHAWLTDIIIKGSKPHVIPTGGAPAQIAKGYPLRFYWENGPTGPGIYRFWKVNHPGTKPNDFVSRVRGLMVNPTRRRLNTVANRVAYLKT